MEEQQASIKSANSNSRIIWIALMFSIFVYGLVLNFRTQDIALDPGRAAEMLMPLVVVAIIEGMIALFFRKKAIQVSNDINTNLRTNNTLEAGQIDSLRINNIICWALSESIAIYGLILSFISGDHSYFLKFASASIALMLISFPKKIG